MNRQPKLFISLIAALKVIDQLPDTNFIVNYDGDCIAEVFTITDPSQAVLCITDLGPYIHITHWVDVELTNFLVLAVVGKGEKYGTRTRLPSLVADRFLISSDPQLKHIIEILEVLEPAPQSPLSMLAKELAGYIVPKAYDTRQTHRITIGLPTYPADEFDSGDDLRIGIGEEGIPEVSYCDSHMNRLVISVPLSPHLSEGEWVVSSALHFIRESARLGEGFSSDGSSLFMTAVRDYTRKLDTVKMTTGEGNER